MGCSTSSPKKAGSSKAQQPAEAPGSPGVSAGESAEKGPGSSGGLADESTEKALERLNVELGPRPRICILGGTAFKGESSEELVVLLAKELARTIDDSAVFITGGMAGVQKTFACSYAIGKNLRHMVPVGEASNFEFGSDLCAGKDLDQRKEIFGNIGDVYITVEGGPGVSTEARSAAKMGAFIVPLVRTGGASGGQFGFPPTALEKPNFATAKQWDWLCSTSAELPDSARAAAAIVAGLVGKCEKRQRGGAKAEALGGTAAWQVKASTFDSVDADGDGCLSREELGQLLGKLSPQFCRAFADGVYDALSHHGKDKITAACFDEWLNSGSDSENRTLVKQHTKDDVAILRVMFKMLDTKGTGHVGKEDAQKVLEKFAHPEGVDIPAIFASLDADGDGQVDFDEFVHAVDKDHQALVMGIFHDRDSSGMVTKQKSEKSQGLPEQHERLDLVVVEVAEVPDGEVSCMQSRFGQCNPCMR